MKRNIRIGDSQLHLKNDTNQIAQRSVLDPENKEIAPDVALNRISCVCFARMYGESYAAGALGGRPHRRRSAEASVRRETRGGANRVCDARGVVVVWEHCGERPERQRGLFGGDLQRSRASLPTPRACPSAALGSA